MVDTDKQHFRENIPLEVCFPCSNELSLPPTVSLKRKTPKVNVPIKERKTFPSPDPFLSEEKQAMRLVAEIRSSSGTT